VGGERKSHIRDIIERNQTLRGGNIKEKVDSRKGRKPSNLLAAGKENKGGVE